MSSSSEHSREILRRNDKRWSSKLLRQDLEELRREQTHLRCKISERRLTDWEVQRVKKITQEIIDLLSKISSSESLA